MGEVADSLRVCNSVIEKQILRLGQWNKKQLAEEKEKISNDLLDVRSKINIIISNSKL